MTHSNYDSLNLVEEKFAFASSVVEVETILDIFDLVLGKVNLNRFDLAQSALIG